MGITHEWVGTKLIITSDSGTSACDLKGERGSIGPRGPQGARGIDGSINLGEFDTSNFATKDDLEALEESVNELVNNNSAEASYDLVINVDCDGFISGTIIDNYSYNETDVYNTYTKVKAGGKVNVAILLNTYFDSSGTKYPSQIYSDNVIAYRETLKILFNCSDWGGINDGVGCISFEINESLKSGTLTLVDFDGFITYSSGVPVDLEVIFNSTTKWIYSADKSAFSANSSAVYEVYQKVINRQQANVILTSRSYFDSSGVRHYLQTNAIAVFENSTSSEKILTIVFPMVEYGTIKGFVTLDYTINTTNETGTIKSKSHQYLVTK